MNILSPSKMEIGKIVIEFLGFRITKGMIALQNHLLHSLVNFPDKITDKTELQRFLGLVNYIHPFYEDQEVDS